MKGLSDWIVAVAALLIMVLSVFLVTNPLESAGKEIVDEIDEKHDESVMGYIEDLDANSETESIDEKKDLSTWSLIVDKEWSNFDNWAGSGLYFYEEDNIRYCTFKIYGSGVPVIYDYTTEVMIEEEGIISLELPEKYFDEEKENSDKTAKMKVEFDDEVIKLTNNGTVILFAFKEQKEDLDDKARSFINKYNLNIEEKLDREKIILEDGLSFELFCNASNKIGLDLNKYKNEEVDVYKYRLKEESLQERSRLIVANILFNNQEEIVGAFLHTGNMPGVVSLDEKSIIKPENLNPEKLNFEGVNKIEILGPREETPIDMWSKK
ncbi:DUF4830 domain-containing protein, partial [Herbivorax sp. ANBcel31]|uniref:DUF4830 domain-containing protein n=1 Tax=Herbivorax sp. ANBcel31 TaxID=3069754 RepID=UPI0027AE2C3D